MVSFEATKEERAAVRRIATRAVKVYAADGIIIDHTSTVMDLLATHANGCPLDFAKLESADEFNLAHDITGIANHLDRRTGKLTGYFLPRSARPAQARKPKRALVTQ